MGVRVGVAEGCTGGRNDVVLEGGECAGDSSPGGFSTSDSSHADSISSLGIFFRLRRTNLLYPPL